MVKKSKTITKKANYSYMPYLAIVGVVALVAVIVLVMNMAGSETTLGDEAIAGEAFKIQPKVSTSIESLKNVELKYDLECYDSDYNTNLAQTLQKGFVTVWDKNTQDTISTFVDECNGDAVIEYGCTNDGAGGNVRDDYGMVKSFGSRQDGYTCEDGKLVSKTILEVQPLKTLQAIKLTETCTDSDDGVGEYFTRSHIIYDGEYRADSCIDNYLLYEMNCVNGNFDPATIDCSDYNMRCVSGKCECAEGGFDCWSLASEVGLSDDSEENLIPTSDFNPNACSDADGYNVFTYGSGDVCITGTNILMERYCENGVEKTRQFDCYAETGNRLMCKSNKCSCADGTLDCWQP